MSSNSPKRIRLLPMRKHINDDASTTSQDMTLFQWNYFQLRSLIAGYLKKIACQSQYRYSICELVDITLKYYLSFFIDVLAVYNQNAVHLSLKIPKIIKQNNTNFLSNIAVIRYKSTYVDDNDCSEESTILFKPTINDIFDNNKNISSHKINIKMILGECNEFDYSYKIYVYSDVLER